MIIIDIDKQESKWHNELWMTKYRIGEFFSSGGATLYTNPSDQTMMGFGEINHWFWTFPLRLFGNKNNRFAVYFFTVHAL